MEDAPETDKQEVRQEPREVPAQPVEPSFDPLYLESIRKFFPIETLRESVRVTPKGLFIEHTFRERFIPSYQSWLESQGFPAPARTEGKVRRRLFGENAALYYLVEGKTVLAGYLALAAIQQPQRFHIPHFLGSLADSRSVLNPHDPVFSAIEGLSAAQSPKGIEISLKLGQETVIIPVDALKEFVLRAEHSPRTMREFPNIKDSQAETLSALVTLLKKSRPVALDKNPRLLPKHIVAQKKISMRTVGSYEFVFGQAHQLIAVLDLKGKNLAHFVLREMQAVRQKGERRIGIFDFASERDRHLGIFHLRGKKIRLATHALAGFVEHVGDSPDKRDRFSQNYSVRDCFEKFSILFQTAQPIEGKLIQTFVAEFKQRGTRFTVNGPWIFVLSPDGLLSHCRARHARPREKR